jgi:hypothetical protein
LKRLYFASLLAVVFSTPTLAQGLFSYGGKTYTDKDLSPAQQQQIFEIAMQNFEQTKSAVDSFIFDLYVEEEAKKQNKSRADVE